MEYQCYCDRDREKTAYISAPLLPSKTNPNRIFRVVVEEVEGKWVWRCRNCLREIKTGILRRFETKGI